MIQMLSNSRNYALAVALWMATFASTVDAAEKLRIDFGVYSANKPSAMVKVFRPMLKELESSLSEKLQREVDIRMQIAKDYDQGISDLVTGSVDVSYFGPASYVEAKRMNPGIKIIAVEKLNNSKVSYGIIAVHKDSDIDSISDIRGKSFAFGDEGSTIGRFLSQLELVQADIFGEDLSRYEYLGRHDKVGTAIGAGAFDAGALNETTFKKLVDEGEPIKELARFPNVSKPWIARAGLDKDVADALLESLLSLNNQSVLSSMKIDGFLEGSDVDYAVIRRAMENNHAFFKERALKVASISAPGATANSTTEPVIQAALSTDKQCTLGERDDSLAVTHSHVTSTNSEATRTVTSRSITVNIELPISHFSNGKYTGPDSLTINVKLPSEVQ